MRKICMILVFCIILVSTIGCDSGLEFVSMTIVSLPDRLEYPVGYTGKIDLQGGSIELTTRDGKHSITKTMQEGCEATTSADFTKPGEYTVKIFLPNGVKQTFVIRVTE